MHTACVNRYDDGIHGDRIGVAVEMCFDSVINELNIG